MMRFFEILKESLRKLIEELEQTTEAIERLGRHIEALNTPSRHDRSFPPYRERLNPRGHVRPIFGTESGRTLTERESHIRG